MSRPAFDPALETRVAPASDRWEDFVWPEWVPLDTRKHIEKFWSAAYGRSPGDWIKSGGAHYNFMAPFGAEVLVWTHDGDLARGRLVHLWNNIHEVVGPDGRIVAHCVAPCDLAEEAEAREVLAKRTRQAEALLAKTRANAARLGGRCPPLNAEVDGETSMDCEHCRPMLLALEAAERGAR